MTKKHYTKIANVLRGETGLGHDDTISEIASALATTFENDNPAFDRERFYQAIWGTGPHTIRVSLPC